MCIICTVQYMIYTVTFFQHTAVNCFLQVESWCYPSLAVMNLPVKCAPSAGEGAHTNGTVKR